MVILFEGEQGNVFYLKAVEAVIVRERKFD